MKRVYSKKGAKIVEAFLAAVILLHLLYASGVFFRLGAATGLNWLVMSSETFRALHVGLMVVVAFVLYSATGKSSKGRLPWYDILLIVVGLGSNLYFVIFYNKVVEHYLRGTITTTEIILGVVVLATMMEAARRAAGGIWMPIIALVFFIYPLIQNYLPGFLYGPPQSFEDVIRHAGPSRGGMYGEMVGLGAIVIVCFLFFGQILQMTKASAFFTGVAMRLFGRLSGGAALASVGASAAFGSICAGSAANAATTGAITIPIMKDVGFKPKFAAAIESAAANGGSILPPVMSSVAFLIADILGITYWQVIVAAWIPGLLYYFAIGVAVYLESHRLGIKGLPREQLPALGKLFVRNWQFVPPVVLLVWYLIYHSPQMAAIYASLALIAASMIRKETRLSWQVLIRALAGTARGLIYIAPLLALAGVMVAGLDFTGLSLRLSSGLIDVSGGSTLILLLLAAIASVVLGMPMSPAATYILLAILVAPALADLGAPRLAAHLFLLWFAMTGPITPPSCSTCFVAASIAGEGVSGFSVGWTAMRLVTIAYILPFTFIYNPALLLIGDPLEIIRAIICAIVGVVFITAGVQGWFYYKLNIVIRVIGLATGFLFIWPAWTTHTVGIIVAIPLVAYGMFHIKKQKKQAATFGT